MIEENNSNKNDSESHLKKKSFKRNSMINQGDVFGDKIFLNDFLFFKNDILKEIKQLDLKINLQNNLSNEINQRLNLYNSKIENLSKKVDDFSKSINHKSGETNYYTDKLDALFEFKSKIEQDSITQNCKFQLMAEELKNAINKYDRLINNNILYPGIIGIDCKFKDYHDFVDYVLLQLKNLSLFKDKNAIDLKSYKNKLESNMKSLNIQTQSLLNNANSFALKNIKDSEDKMFNEIKLFDEKVNDIRVEYVNWVNRVEKQNIEMKNEWNKILFIKKDITEFIEERIENIKNSNDDIKKLFSNYQEEFNEVKNYYILLLDFIQKNLEKKQEKSDKKKSIIKNKPNQEINNIDNKKEIINIEDKKEEINNKNDKFNNFENILNKEEKIPIKNKNRINKIQRVKTAESIIKNYIQGKTTLEELMAKREKKIKKDVKNNDYPISIVTLVSFKQLYDENINNMNKNNIYKTIDNRIKSHSNISTEKNRNNKSENKSMNNSPKNLNLNSSEKNALIMNQIKQKFNARLRNSQNKKILLMKEGENIIRSKSKENEIKNSTINNNDNEKYTLNNKYPNIKQINDISFLIEDKNNIQFPIIEDCKAKQIEIYKYLDKKNIIKNKISSHKKIKNKNKSISLIKSNYKKENIYLINNAKSNKLKYSLSSENILGYNNLNNKIRKEGNI